MSRFGTMIVTGTDQFQGRRYFCRCGWEGWTAWGHAIRHAESCPQAKLPNPQPLGASPTETEKDRA